MSPAFKDVCRKPDCIEVMNTSCDKVHACGHPCVGFKNEKKCLPCLQDGCIVQYNKTVEPAKQILDGCTSDDYCEICYTSGLGEMPVVMLACKHMFHVECLFKLIA